MQHEHVPGLVMQRQRREREGILHSEMRSNGRSLKQLQLSLRRAKVAELLLKGWKQEEVANFLKVAIGTITSDIAWVRQEWARERVENADLYVRQEVDKLENDEYDIRRRIRALPDNSMELALKAYTHILRIMQRRAKMLGLDTPTTLKISVEQVETVVQQIIAVVVTEIDDPEKREKIGHRILELIAPKEGIGE